MTSVKFQSRKTVESKIYPGVQFTIRVLSEGIRTRIRLSLAEPLMKIRDLNKELEGIEIPDGTTDSPELKQAAGAAYSKVMRITDETTSVVQSQIDPVYFKHGFISIQGLEIDGSSDVSAEQLIELAPVDLYDEIVSVIKHGSELTENEVKNSDSPITSVEAQDGRGQNTTAQTAEPTNSI